MHPRIGVLVRGAAAVAALVPVVIGAGSPEAGRFARADERPARADAAGALAPGGRVWLHAHNCYPEQGAWRDRIDRALGTGLPWVAIEQDLAWATDPAAPGGGRSVVSHEEELVGGEPTLDEHFFQRVQPLLDRALADGQVKRWPVLILHLDFKTHEPEHHRAVWDLLGRYERYLTTAVKPADGSRVEPLRPGPLLVLTESGEGQEGAFYTRQPVGGTLRLFGTVPPPELSEEARKRRHTFAPAVLVRSGPTTYRRWVNLPWDAVERGGPDEAGQWTAAEDARLRALVGRAHGLGLWIRFYALNGHPADAGQGWSASYNFGSLAAARARWRAALAAGVEFVATDQYEAFAAELGPGTSTSGFLRASGTRIVDGEGKEVLLRGMGLGGWMLQEGYMLGIKQEGTQHAIRARIADLIGKEETDRFYRLWLKNHMTRADVDRLAASGFNSIRLPMHYNLFTLPIEEEPVRGKDTWLETGFTMVDELLGWCRVNRMYLILDLHAAPGGQGKDANISDYDPAKPSLWESEENRRKTVALWRKLAERYAREPYIGGYDLINEPNWTFEGKDKNGREDLANTPIWDLYRDIIRAIREVDPHHLIIIEGNGWGNNYNGYPGPSDPNLVISFHKYWNPNTEESIARFLALRDKYRVPIWLGESGENTNEWFRECVALVERHGIGWAWWPYKKVATGRCIMSVAQPPDFKKVVDYWNGEGERPTRDEAMRGLFELVENLKAEHCRFNADVAAALIPGSGQTRDGGGPR